MWLPAKELDGFVTKTNDRAIFTSNHGKIKKTMRQPRKKEGDFTRDAHRRLAAARAGDGVRARLSGGNFLVGARS